MSPEKVKKTAKAAQSLWDGATKRTVEWLFQYVVGMAGVLVSLYWTDLMQYYQTRAFSSEPLSQMDFIFAAVIMGIVTLWDISNGDDDVKELKMKQRIARHFLLGALSQTGLEKLFGGGFPPPPPPVAEAIGWFLG